MLSETMCIGLSVLIAFDINILSTYWFTLHECNIMVTEGNMKVTQNVIRFVI